MDSNRESYRKERKCTSISHGFVREEGLDRPVSMYFNVTLSLVLNVCILITPGGSCRFEMVLGKLLAVIL